MSGFAAMLVKFSGWLDILFGAVQLAYWFLVPRRKLLQNAGPDLTRQVDVTNLQIAAALFGIGIILLRFADDIASLKAGKDILILAAVIWAIRALFPRYGNKLDDKTAQISYVWSGRILMSVFMLMSVLHLLPVVLG
jgi:hypothetical protein